MPNRYGSTDVLDEAAATHAALQAEGSSSHGYRVFLSGDALTVFALPEGRVFVIAHPIQKPCVVLRPEEVREVAGWLQRMADEADRLAKEKG